MSLETRLKNTAKYDEECPAPADLRTLKNNYVHASNVTASPSDASDIAADLRKVIALQPTMMTRCVSSQTHEPFSQRGYFAYGRRDKDDVVFEVYIPHKGVTKDFPSHSLRKHIGDFMLCLVEEGYDVTGVEFLLSSDEQLKQGQQ